MSRMVIPHEGQAFTLSAPAGSFVAVNYITCEEHYRERFEELFTTRAHAIDTLPGFLGMNLLKPNEDGHYLVISHWESEEQFQAWTKSPEFIEGHKRAFADLKRYKEEGKKPPMDSDFKTYTVLCQ